MTSLLISIFVIFGCSQSGSNPPPAGPTCPLLAMQPSHSVYVTTSDPMPEKAMIMIDGKIKYDECLEQPVLDAPPVVRFFRNNSGFEVHVVHYGAYPVLPESTEISIIDRKDCGNDAVSYFAAEVPLEFKTEYPYGPKCGRQVSAKATISK